MKLLGFEENPELGRHYLTLYAEQPGITFTDDEVRKLGNDYAWGRGGPVSFAQAAHFYRRMLSGNPHDHTTQNNLAGLSHTGRTNEDGSLDYKQNLDEARVMYSLAANRGLDFALLNLAYMDFVGEGLAKPNWQDAAKNLRKGLRAFIEDGAAASTLEEAAHEWRGKVQEYFDAHKINQEYYENWKTLIETALQEKFLNPAEGSPYAQTDEWQQWNEGDEGAGPSTKPVQ